MNIQPRFVGIGLGLALGIACFAAMAPAGSGYHGKAITYGPDPWNMVQIREGTPYVVPQGRIFVLTALGATANETGSIVLSRDGIAQAEVLQAGSWSGMVSVRPTPLGCAATNGATLSVDGGVTGQNDARAWGYVVAQSFASGASAAIQVPYGPRAEDLVQITSGQPYVVPANKILVVTGLGCAYPTGGPQSPPALVSLSVDGQRELSRYSPHTDAFGSIVAVPPGMSVGSGATVLIEDLDPTSPSGTAYGRCWGYLANR